MLRAPSLCCRRAATQACPPCGDVRPQQATTGQGESPAVLALPLGLLMCALCWQVLLTELRSISDTWAIAAGRAGPQAEAPAGGSGACNGSMRAPEGSGVGSGVEGDAAQEGGIEDEGEEEDEQRAAQGMAGPAAHGAAARAGGHASASAAAGAAGGYGNFWELGCEGSGTRGPRMREPVLRRVGALLSTTLPHLTKLYVA